MGLNSDYTMVAHIWTGFRQFLAQLATHSGPACDSFWSCSFILDLVGFFSSKCPKCVASQDKMCRKQGQNHTKPFYNESPFQGQRGQLTHGYSLFQHGSPCLHWWLMCPEGNVSSLSTPNPCLQFCHADRSYQILRFALLSWELS